MKRGDYMKQLSKKTKRNLVAYSFIAPNFIGFSLWAPCYSRLYWPFIPGMAIIRLNLSVLQISLKWVRIPGFGPH